MKKQKRTVSDLFLVTSSFVRLDIHESHLSLLLFSAEAEKSAREGEKEDYKGDSKFATHLKMSSGVSNFARTRTLKEQREYLPAFACREELMKVIRENQGMLEEPRIPTSYERFYYSYCGRRRDWFGKDDTTGTILI